MAAAKFADIVRGQTDEALRKGAKALMGGKHAQDKPGSPYLTPQVLVDVNHQMSVMREESFGPVVGIMKVADDVSDAYFEFAKNPHNLSRLILTKRQGPDGAGEYASFKTKAAAHAQQFGYASYSLREVSVSGGESGGESGG